MPFHYRGQRELKTLVPASGFRLAARLHRHNSLELMLLRRVGVAHDHLHVGVAEQRGERHQANACFGCARGEGVPEIVKPERAHE